MNHAVIEYIDRKGRNSVSVRNTEERDGHFVKNLPDYSVYTTVFIDIYEAMYYYQSVKEFIRKLEDR